MIPVTDPEILIYYTAEVVAMISEKYNFDHLVALEKYWASETYQMMKDPELYMIQFAAFAIFDMWEVEQLTGNPRESVYIRS